MGFKLDDYFEGYEPEESRKPEAKPEEEEPRKPKPEEEEYADVFIESRGQRRRRFRKWLLLILFVLAFAVGLYFWLLSASASDGHLRGYVVKIELRKGILFDSYEGILVADYPDRTDTITQIIYPFSTRNEALGQRLTATMATDSAVVITYDRYRTALPWRGGTTTIVREVKTVRRTPMSRSPKQVAADTLAKPRTPAKRSSK